MRVEARSGVGLMLRLVLLAAAVLAPAAVMAAPAVAEPTPTRMTLNAQTTTVDWGATAILNGVLKTASNPPVLVDQQTVMVESSASASGPWNQVAQVTNAAEPYSSGAYTYSFTADRNTYWHMNFEGTAEWGASTSNVVFVKVRPLVGKPSCPSSIKAKKKFTVSGTLKPRFTAGAKTVQIKAYLKKGSGWKLYRTYKARNSDSGPYTRYWVRLSISKKGKFRFKGVTARSGAYAAATSASSRTLTVK